MTTWWFAPHMDNPEASLEERDERQLVEGDYAYDGPYGVPAVANLQGSPNGDGTHSIVLDLDCRHEYRPSTTPGHGHLIIEAKLSPEHYGDLLGHLERAGVISTAYYSHASRREWATFVRPAGLKKPESAPSSDGGA